MTFHPYCFDKSYVHIAHALESHASIFDSLGVNDLSKICTVNKKKFEN
jgi:hypothetical protein